MENNPTVTHVYTIFFTMALAMLASSLATCSALSNWMSRDFWVCIMFAIFYVLARTKFYLDDMRGDWNNLKGNCLQKWHFILTVATWFCWIMAARINPINEQAPLFLQPNMICLIVAFLLSTVINGLVVKAKLKPNQNSASGVMVTCCLCWICVRIDSFVKKHGPFVWSIFNILYIIGCIVAFWHSFRAFLLLIFIAFIDLCISKSYQRLYHNKPTDTYYPEKKIETEGEAKNESV